MDNYDDIDSDIVYSSSTFAKVYHYYKYINI